jgi:hypothetical protein
MVGLSTRDGPGAIQLLGKHQPRHFVREGPRRQRKALRGTLPDLGCEPVRTTDKKSYVSTVLAPALHRRRKFPRRQTIPVLIAGDNERPVRTLE